MTDEEAIDRFSNIFTDRRCWAWKWHGIEIAKNPMDLAVYQEILWEHRPDTIIECGTFKGGSALFLAEQLDVAGHGRIFSIDVVPDPVPHHSRITYLSGSSVDPKIVERVRVELAIGDKVMVILDSDHAYGHVLAELLLWSPLVAKGQYLVVEDTCINGHPVLPGWGRGPFEATADFLRDHKEFCVDRSREKFLSTFNPSGYLLRV